MPKIKKTAVHSTNNTPLQHLWKRSKFLQLNIRRARSCQIVVRGRPKKQTAPGWAPFVCSL